MRDERLEKLARLLVEYSTEVKKGDTVAVSGEEAALPFIKAVARAAIEKGAYVSYYVDLPEIEEYLLKHGEDAQISQPNNRFGACASADVWISAWGTKNVNTLSNADGEKLKIRRLGNRENRQKYQKRSGDGSLRWCGTQFPADGDAQNASMSLAEYEDFVYGAGFLDCPNPVEKWKEMEAMQIRWVRYLNQKKSLRVCAKGTDITIGIAGRKWIACCGHENFPDGEIFTSPQEKEINGVITFSYPAILNGNEFEQVTLRVEKGRIIQCSCANKEMEEKLKSYLDTDEGSRYFGEVAIGTNYHIRQFTKNILFDEKIGGTMHMAVGAAMEEAGGVNVSSIHWDMITSMIDGGKIYADGELFYDNGKFIDRVLENNS